MTQWWPISTLSAMTVFSSITTYEPIETLLPILAEILEELRDDKNYDFIIPKDMVLSYAHQHEITNTVLEMLRSPAQAKPLK